MERGLRNYRTNTIVAGAAMAVAALASCGELPASQHVQAAPEIAIDGPVNAYAVAVRGTLAPEVESPPSCNKAAWLEGFLSEDGIHLTHAYAVYDTATRQVTRYNASDVTSALDTTYIEVDPSDCTSPGIVYQAFEGSTQIVERRNLPANVRQRVIHPFMQYTEMGQPDPLNYPAGTRPVYLWSQASGQNNVEVTEGHSVGNTAVNDFAVSDDGRVYGDVQEYTLTKDANAGPEQFSRVNVYRYVDATQQRGELLKTAEFKVSPSEHVRKIEVSPEGSRVFVLRATGGTPPRLFEVVRSTTNAQLLDYRPFEFDGSAQSRVIDFRLAGPGTAVAIVQDNTSYAQKMVSIDLAIGATAELTTANVVYVQF